MGDSVGGDVAGDEADAGLPVSFQLGLLARVARGHGRGPQQERDLDVAAFRMCGQAREDLAAEFAGSKD